MAANDYYNPSHGHDQHPQSQYTSYDPQRIHSPSIYTTTTNAAHDHNTVSSPSSYNPSAYNHPISPQEDTGYRPYAQSNNSAASPYLASGGRDHDNPFADDVPLRQHPSKQSSDVVMQDHLPEDPALIDRPPQQRRHKRRRKGFFAKKIPWVVYTLTTIQVIVFIAELGKNGALTGSPIEIHPQFNPMIGPSPYVQINMGARYVPCMRRTDQGLDTTISWPCPNSTSLDVSDKSNSCHLNNLCGFGAGAYDDKHLPNQWYRFIIPMFLHAGIIHIGFNMLLQILLGGDMEREIGSIRFTLVYLSSGIFGFVLGGNFAPEGIASTGASGSLFGIIALMLLDLLYHWGEREQPWVDLAWLILDIAISFVLGLLPGLDNFSHIGGFLMGLVLGICLLHTPDILRRRVGADAPPYTSVRQSRIAMDTGGLKGFAKEPVGFFKGRKPMWWAWWLVRAAALIGVLVAFIVLLKNFYKAHPDQCGWCKHLSCLPIKNWCDIGSLTVQKSNGTTSPNKRSLLELAMPGMVLEGPAVDVGLW